MAESKVSLKLLIDTKAKTVLFAEVDKDCVDFLFYILSLPVAKLISLVGKQAMVGSLGNLYESLENMKESYILPNKSKVTLLEPPPSISAASVPLLAINSGSFSSSTVTKMLYTCGNCSTFGVRNGSDGPGAICPNCRNIITSPMTYVAPPGPKTKKELSDNEGGFVKGVVTYMVMDNLVVMPLSTISSITLLNKFNIKEVGALEEKVVNMGMDEVIHINLDVFPFN